MSNRRRGRKPTNKSTKRRTRRVPAQRRSDSEEPDLVRDVADALADDHPLTMLSLVSSLLAALEPTVRGPFDRPGDPELPSVEELVQMFLEIEIPETSALLTVIAELAGDELLRRRIRREVVARAHPLPGWLIELGRTTPIDRVVEVVHVLGDGDDIVVGVRLSGGTSLTFFVYVDHNLGTVVKDAFVVPAAVSDVIELKLGAAAEQDVAQDMSVRDLDPADARARVAEAIEMGARMFPPLESDSWPACRPLVEWAVRMLPEGGTAYQRPEWDDGKLATLTERFFASPFGAGLDDADRRGLLDSLLWFGTDYGPGDPLRWSPVAVEILLVDWIPRKIVAEAGYLAKAPELLRAFIRFSHAERGIRSGLTDETIAAVDRYEPEYQRTIRSPRPQGPAALLAAMGVLHPDAAWPELSGPTDVAGIMLNALRRAVGGESPLNALDTAALPDEPFGWTRVPADVHDRVAEVLTLVDGCCDTLLDQEYRTACRRLLAHAAEADPGIFRGRGRSDTAAAAFCWIVGKANRLFSPYDFTVKELAAHFGLGQGSFSGRGKRILQAVGVDPSVPGELDLGSSRYLTAARREQIVDERDHYRAVAEGQHSSDRTRT